MDCVARTAYVAFGGNLGDPRETLRTAIPLIEERIGRVELVSSLYETKALTIDGSIQPNYLNAVLSLSTVLEPSAILGALLEIERVLGRDRSPNKRWEPRVIDLDLLFVEDVIESTALLTLPHPEIPNRDFVLEPLAEIAPNLIHPTLNRSIAGLLEELSLRSRERFVLGKLAAAR